MRGSRAQRRGLVPHVHDLAWYDWLVVAFSAWTIFGALVALASSEHRSRTEKHEKRLAEIERRLQIPPPARR